MEEVGNFLLVFQARRKRHVEASAHGGLAVDEIQSHGCEDVGRGVYRGEGECLHIYFRQKKKKKEMINLFNLFIRC